MAWPPNPSVTENILAYFASALAVTKPDPAIQVARARRRPSSKAELPLVTIKPIRETVTTATANRTSGKADRTLTVNITVRCAGEDTDLDRYRTWVLATVMRDPSAGGWAVNVSESQHDWLQDDDSDSDYCEDVIQFDVRYVTARATPEAAA